VKIKSKDNHRRNIIATIIAVVMALFILFVSIARASLEIASSRDANRDIRKMEVECEVNGEKFTYKLPQARILPDDPIYFFKRVRDWLWLNFAKDKLEKSDIALFIADKKMAETQVLLSKGKINLALATSQEALNKLKYARSLHPTDQNYYAGWSYAKILQNYNQKIQVLDEWNQQQKK